VELDEAARRAATAVERCTWRLEEAPDRLAPLLAAAMPGDVLGPVPEDATHALWRVLSREPAAADDPELVRRAQREIVAAHIRRAAAGRVSYLKPV
jgi:hypothetical protein